jgi:hypothetical protein
MLVYLNSCLFMSYIHRFPADQFLLPNEVLTDGANIAEDGYRYYQVVQKRISVIAPEDTHKSRQDVCHALIGSGSHRSWIRTFPLTRSEPSTSENRPALTFGTPLFFCLLQRTTPPLAVPFRVQVGQTPKLR